MTIDVSRTSAHLAIGMGTSVEPRSDNLVRGIRELRDKVSIETASTKMSSWYYSRACVPWGSKDLRPIEYINCVMTGSTVLAPDKILLLLKDIEIAFGRDINAKRWSPRPIDLDIIVYNNEPFEAPELTIPHPRAIERTWVLAPLGEIWPDAYVHHASHPEVQTDGLKATKSQALEPSSIRSSGPTRTDIDVTTILEYYAGVTIFEKITPAHIIIEEHQLGGCFFRMGL